MIKRGALLLVMLLLSLPTAVLAAEAGSGVINGQLVNGTQGGASVADQTITLTTYLNDAETGTATAKSGADGKFVFTGLATGPGYAYEPKVTYQEADYTGERLSFSANETAKALIMKVYDSTGSDSAVKISIAHTIVTPVEGGLEVVEFLVFTNDSDRSYIGFGDVTTTGTRRTLRLPLPDKVSDLQYGGDLMSCCVLQDPTGFFDTMAVLPGEKTIVYSYSIKNGSASYAFARKVDYPTANYNVLVKGENTDVSAQGLTASGPVDLQGTVYNSLAGDNLARGATLDVRLTGLPKSGSQQAVIWVLVAVVVLGAGGAFAYMMKRKGLQAVGISSSPDEMRQQLLLDIAKLDDDFEGGRIEKEAYTKLRAEKKTQLVGLMQSSAGEYRRG